MYSFRKPAYLLTIISTMALCTLISCESENTNYENLREINGLIELNNYEIDFGEVKSRSGKNSEEFNEEILTLYNNSEDTLTGLSSFITFPGRAGVSLIFSPVVPNDSISVPFTYSADGLPPGEYTGEARLVPSIGDSLTVLLKATVIE